MIRALMAAAMVISITAAIFFAPLASAGEKSDRILAAELLILRGDLDRLQNSDDLPAAHRSGLNDRIAGSRGLLPWLLKQAGDRSEDLDTSEDLESGKLNRLIARHPLDLDPFTTNKVTPDGWREAGAIHEAYCASCHDDAGRGDPDQPLPARDLYKMAQQADSVTFLARLINGVKGDQSLLFANPLTDPQLQAMWMFYLRGP